MLPLLEIVGVTSTEMTYSIDFAFLECEKEDNVIWTLEMCHNLLKDSKNISQVIVTNCNTSQMKSIVKIFPSSYALLCRYHITKI